MCTRYLLKCSVLDYSIAVDWNSRSRILACSCRQLGCVGQLRPVGRSVGRSRQPSRKGALLLGAEKFRKSHSIVKNTKLKTNTLAHHQGSHRFPRCRLHFCRGGMSPAGVNSRGHAGDQVCGTIPLQDGARVGLNLEPMQRRELEGGRGS